jgi:hypothetical protein
MGGLTKAQQAALHEADEAASRARAKAEDHAEAVAERNAAVRAAVAAGLGLRHIARETGLDPAHVLRISRTRPE